MPFAKKPVRGAGWVFAAILVIGAIAKAVDGDWQMWNDQFYTQNLGYGVDAVLRAEQRWEEDIGRLGYFELEPMVNWRYSPRWDFTLGYERDERLSPEEEREIDNMAAAAVTLKVPLRDWNIRNRFRFESVVPESDEMNWSEVYRNRTEINTIWRWGSRELVPYLAEEVFVHIQNGELTQSRMEAGVGIPIVPHWMARVYFMRFDEKTAEGWQWHPVLGVQVEAQF